MFVKLSDSSKFLLSNENSLIDLSVGLFLFRYLSEIEISHSTCALLNFNDPMFVLLSFFLTLIVT